MLPRLTRHCDFCLGARGKVQLGFRNLVSSSVPSNRIAEIVRPPRPSFPWLQKYKFYSGIEGFYNRARLQRTFDILSGMISSDGQDESLRNHMTRSGIEALRFSASSIFRSAQDKYKVVTENTWTKEDETMSLAAYTPMSDVLDGKLNQFYESAIHDQFSYLVSGDLLRVAICCKDPSSRRK